ncbi:hypothetical protein GCM10025777_12010 [Membranihabitans marinus]
MIEPWHDKSYSRYTISVLCTNLCGHSGVNLDQGRKTKYIHKSRSSLDLLEGVLRFKYLAFSMMLDT